MTYPTTDKEIASFWGVRIRTLYRWKGDNAPLGNQDEMIAWLSTRKNLPRAVLERVKLPTQQNASSPVSGDSGAAAALRRLESTELQAFARLQTALAGGNSLLVREARESWLKISESLRRFDLLVEANRRDAGELVPVAEVQTFIDYFITYAGVVFTQRAEELTNELLGKGPRETYGQLRKVFDEALVTCIFGYIKGGKTSDQRLVAYAEACVRGRFAHYKKTPLFDNAEENILKWAQS